VEIVQGERTLRADWISFNAETGNGVASGDVELVDGGDVLRAAFIEFDIHNLEGVLYRAHFESDASRFVAEGDTIAKTGGQTYRFENGTFTTCQCPEEDQRPPWRIRAKEADVEIEGYGTTRNTTVEVLGIPAVWLPWMIYPIKTQRQTGLLFPDVALGSRNGFSVGLPFFWAAHEQLNLTLTPRYSSKRGFQGDAAAEYVFGRESWGDVLASYAYDQEIDPNTPQDPFGRQRWAVLGRQGWVGPAALRFQSDFAFVSDNQYPIDYDAVSEHRADRFLQSSAFVTRALGSTGRYGASVSALYADDLQNPNDQDRDEFLMQRLPDVTAAVLPGPLRWLPLLLPSLDVDYTYFRPLGSARQARPTSLPGAGGIFLDTGVDSLPNAQERGPGLPTTGSCPVGPAGTDPHADDAESGGTECDGLFQEGEPLTDEGQRLWLHPRIAAPLQLGDALELYSEVGWHQTLYDTRELDFQQRGFLTARVDVRSRLRRSFGNWSHVLEPRAGYALALTDSQRGNPLFVPATALPQERIRALDLDTVTRDTADRIERANRISFGFGNRFYGDLAGSGAARLLADVTLLGLYDFEAGAFSHAILDGRAYPTRRIRSRFNVDYDTESGRLAEALAGVAWTHAKGHGLSAGYRYVRDIPDTFEDYPASDRFKDFRSIERVDQLNAALRFAVTAQWSLAYRFAYSAESGTILANNGIIEYVSRCRCWAAGLELSADRARGVEVKVLYRIVGLGRDDESASAGFLDVF
jgi:lipopolysaccharide assembly outer membrane protein LptD (OstA)